ncbi:TonB-dependent receptor plug domain-containing protein [Sphingomonas sp. PP-CE-1G-424]|uniref:TonB-dependent receptor n=1 Tax=Sphingomonas sp. PP-CE-1G-424 TaxID=2135658 RepID=UPI0010556A81|nr:TonB-dependent receptor plug domain-containing protein [Sphingomonas sp. PP-CE-1G-424]
MDRGSSISFARFCLYGCVALMASSISSAPAYADKPAQGGISIAQGSLRTALDSLARQTGISIGMAGSLPAVQVKRIDHVSDIARALRKLLAGTHLRAVRVDATTWRIEPASHRDPVERHREIAPPADTGGDIIVTASKRDERLSDLPASIGIFGAPALDHLSGKRGLVDLLAATDGAFSTNLGPGRDRVFLRGVADSAFNGTSQSLVSLYLDDARIGYSSPDPDLRMVDIDHVEILRGPQGTLYGTGALGGVVRIVTTRPDLDSVSQTLSTEVTGIKDGALGGALDATVNLPIVTGSVALRASAWAETMPGWIDDSGRGKRNVNRTGRTGARAALRWAIGDGWTATASGVGQWIDTRDSQYATRGLTRATSIAEPQDNDFVTGSLDIRGSIGRLDVQSTSSVVSHDFTSTYDASSRASLLDTATPLAYDESREIRLLTQEFRVSDPSARHPWIIGASLLNGTTRLKGSFVAAGDAIEARDDKEAVFEAALFAEGTERLSSALDFKLGLRGFVTTNDIEQQGPQEQSATKLGVTPSATLSWHRDDIGLVWLRYASAIRPAAVSRDLPGKDQKIPGDELQSLELGWRIRAFDDRVSLTGAVFGSVWKHLRSDVVDSDGLFGTIDVGNATNYGIEFGARMDARPLTIDVGTTIQRARLTSPSEYQRGNDDDRRLPVVPDFSARFGLTRKFSLIALPASAYLTARYIGQTRLSFDPTLDRRAGNYATVAAGATVDDGPRHWSLAVDNLLNGRGNSFGFGNPFTLASIKQTVPVRPRAITLSLSIGF